MKSKFSFDGLGTNENAVTGSFFHFLNWLRPALGPLLALSLLLFGGFNVVGVSVTTSMQLSIVLTLFTLPFYVAFWTWSVTPKDGLTNLVSGFGAGTITLALIFGLTPISTTPFVFWLVCLIINSFFITVAFVIWRPSSVPIEGLTRGTSYSMLMIASFVYLAAAAHRVSSPMSGPVPKWIPDDYPIFAEWARTLSQGGLNAELIEGFSLRYHWLTYSFLGGLDRLFGENFMTGPLQTGPIVAWTGLGLGALALARRLTLAPSAAVLSVSAVLFANTTGVLAYSTGSLGGVVVSPSHLIASSWIMVCVLIGLAVFAQKRYSTVALVILFILGFSMALSKFTAFAVVAVIYTIFMFMQYSSLSTIRRSDSIFRPVTLLTSFVLGGGMAYLAFVSGTGVEIAFEPAFYYSAGQGLQSYIVQLMPIGAYAFSLLVLVLPTLTLFKWRRKSDPLLTASVVLALLGLFIALIFQLKDSNEAWFISEALALILPVSAALVAMHIGLFKLNVLKGFLVWTVLVLFASMGAILLLVTRTDIAFQLRPWLTPLSLFLLSCLSGGVTLALLHPHGLKTKRVLQTGKYLISLTIITLFITSITYGLILRGHSVASALQDRAEISLVRDAWLSEAKSIIDSEQFSAGNKQVAIYSTSIGEQSIVRWIPYLVGKNPYYLRNDDLLHLVYVSKDQVQMLVRETNVRMYVEEGSAEGCAALRNDGILQIWITPNVDFAGPHNSSSLKHAIVDVECDGLR